MSDDPYFQNLTQKVEPLLKEEGAFIFSGPPGSGKDIFCLDLINKIVPKEHQPTSLISVSPATITKKGKTKTQKISIAQIREALNSLSLASPAPVMLCVIHQAEAMTPEAQNALLKSLEEPRKSRLFFLLTQAAEKLLPTIRSRSTLIRINLENPLRLYENFLSAGIEADLAQKAASFSWGRRQFAKQIVADEKETALLEAAKQELKNLLTAPLYERLTLLEKTAGDTPSLKSKIDFWLVLLTASLEEHLSPSPFFLSKTPALNYNYKKTAALIKNLLKLKIALEGSASPRLALEAAFLDF